MDETEFHFRDLIHSTPTPIALFDAQDHLRFANSAFRQMFALKDDDYPTWIEIMRHGNAQGRGVSITSQPFENWLQSAHSRRGKTPFRGIESDMLSGQWIWMTETVNNAGWMLCIAVDITSLAQDGRELRYARDIALRASQTDELTGVANRRCAFHQFEQVLENRGGGSIAILDIDHFKSVNDRFGHAIGDIVLRDFAQKVTRSVRLNDIFGRIGGEEFIMVLPGTDEAKAAFILDRIRRQVEASRPLPDYPDFSYTFSVGVAQIQDNDTTSTAFTRADQACYLAKKSGRNKVMRVQAA